MVANIYATIRFLKFISKFVKALKLDTYTSIRGGYDLDPTIYKFKTKRQNFNKKAIRNYPQKQNKVKRCRKRTHR